MSIEKDNASQIVTEALAQLNNASLKRLIEYIDDGKQLRFEGEVYKDGQL